MKIVMAVLAAATLAGCASSSGIVPIGDGILMVNKQAATGFPGLGNLKAEVYQQATEHCAAEARKVSTVQYSETKGPYILGNYPRVDLSFKCV